jgi:hypothetical protein
VNNAEYKKKRGEEMYTKITYSGGIIEVNEYEKLNIRGNGGRQSQDGIYSEENYTQRQRIRRNRIRQLICENFDNTSKFVTLTFRNTEKYDIKNVIECNREFTLFVKRMKRKQPDFKYIAVIEFQDKNKRGAVHYHMICNSPYLPAAELERIWGNGFVKINAIDKVDNLGAYVIKYMTVDTDDARLCGLKAYNHSCGLSEPVELCSWKSSDEYAVRDELKRLEKETPSYGGKTYESEHAGKIKYTQYNMNRKQKATPK